CLAAMPADDLSRAGSIPPRRKPSPRATAEKSSTLFNAIQALKENSMSRMFCQTVLLCFSIFGLAAQTVGHDTWLQTNTHLVRVGDAIHIDLLLGNHGNDHRDFKLASKVDPASGTTLLVSPSGKRYDLLERFVDLGLAPKEGFHAAKFAVVEPGLYVETHTSDRVVNHGEPTRSLKS